MAEKLLISNKSQSLDFLFMIFQPNPKKELVYYWLDGNSGKRIMTFDKFCAIVINNQKECIPQAKEALTTCSFYMWNTEDKRIVHLLPKSNDDAYQDTFQKYMQGHKQQKPYHVSTKETTTLEDQLMKLQFAFPREEDIKNLRVAFERTEEPPTGFARLYHRLFKK